jgi:regulator of RNase E activity RraA
MNTPGPNWQNDDELFELARRHLYTAVVGDIMDKMGARSQFLPAQIRPLDPRMVTVGRAMTVLEADLDDRLVPTSGSPADPKPFGLMLRALDNLQKGEIYVCGGASPRYALWGELMSTRAMHCGAVGAVVDGYSRDTESILRLGFPTFSHGSYAQDQAPRGRVVDFRVDLVIGGACVAPGDILFGDIDGVCVIPRLIERDVFALALEKARGEKIVQKAIAAGMTAEAAFAKYGIM